MRLSSRAPRRSSSAAIALLTADFDMPSWRRRRGEAAGVDHPREHRHAGELVHAATRAASLPGNNLVPAGRGYPAGVAPYLRRNRPCRRRYADDQGAGAVLFELRPHRAHGRGGRGRRPQGRGRRGDREAGAGAGARGDRQPVRHQARPGGAGRAPSRSSPTTTRSSSARRPASATWRRRCATSSTRPAACG